MLNIVVEIIKITRKSIKIEKKLKGRYRNLIYKIKDLNGRIYL